MSSPLANDNSGQDHFSEKPLPSVSQKVLRGDQLFKYVADSLGVGKGKTEICQELIAMGYPSADLPAWIDQVAEWKRRNSVSEGLPRYPGVPNNFDSIETFSEREGAGKTNMRVGAFVCVVGILFTYGTYAAAVEHGGTYIITVGPIVWGASQFFRGLWQSNE